MRQWAAWILAGALILAGIVYKSWPLISSGAAVLGFPGIVPQQFATIKPQEPKQSTEGNNQMWRTRADRAADNETPDGSGPPPAIGPETDASVFLPEDGENQTAAREEFVKNIGLEK